MGVGLTAERLTSAPNDTAGVSSHVVGNVEDGHAWPDLITMSLLARALGLTVRGPGAGACGGGRGHAGAGRCSWILAPVGCRGVGSVGRRVA